MSGALIIGASVAGVSAARGLRGAGYEGSICLVDSEDELPYDKPPLSKELNGEPKWLLTTSEADDLNVQLHLGVEATRVDPQEQMVEFVNADPMPYDHLILALGVRARPSPWTASRVITLRTLSDARTLHARLAAAHSVLLVGAGFIGAELAGMARSAGKEVHLVDVAEVPLADRLGRVAGELIAQSHGDNNVNTHFGRSISDLLDADAGGVRATLDDGTILEADVAVVALGTVTDLSWLGDAGLDITDGISCDEFGRALGVENVYSVGDAARWTGPSGEGVRFEHWTLAVEQGHAVGSTIARPEQPMRVDSAPYIWSDQYGRVIQVVGLPPVREEPSVFVQGARTAIVWLGNDGVAQAAVTIGWPKVGMLLRRSINARQPANPILEALGPATLGVSP